MTNKALSPEERFKIFAIACARQLETLHDHTEYNQSLAMLLLQLEDAVIDTYMHLAARNKSEEAINIRFYSLAASIGIDKPTLQKIIQLTNFGALESEKGSMLHGLPELKSGVV